MLRNLRENSLEMTHFELIFLKSKVTHILREDYKTSGVELKVSAASTDWFYYQVFI